MAEPPDLTPDVDVGNLQATTGDGVDRDVVRLIGFLGGEVQEGYVRLYADAALTSWLDLNKDDIVRRDRLAYEDGTVGGRSSIYVKGAAMRKPVRRRQEDPEAEFLSASPDIEELVSTTLEDVAEEATFLDDNGKFLLTFRTCKP